MRFPYGPRQPNQIIAEDVLAACTPEDLPGRLLEDALDVGTPNHDSHYVGHAVDVWDTPLSKFFMAVIERPFNIDGLELVRGIYYEITKKILHNSF